jgi:hypothetical protein
VSGRRPIPIPRPVVPVAPQGAGEPGAPPADRCPRREHPANEEGPAVAAAEERLAVAPGFPPAAGRLRGPAASAGLTGATRATRATRRYRRSQPGTDRELCDPGGNQKQRDRTPAPRSRDSRRGRPGHTRRARTDPRARTGPRGRSPPPTRIRRTCHRGRSGRTPGGRTGRPSLAGHPSCGPGPADSMDPRPGHSRRPGRPPTRPRRPARPVTRGH